MLPSIVLTATVMLVIATQPGQPPGGLGLPRQPDRPGIFAPSDDDSPSSTEEPTEQPATSEPTPTGTS